MRDGPGDEPPVPPDDGGPSPLVLLLAAIVVVVGGYFLAIKLKDMVQMQDCAMSGRTNCTQILSSPKQ